MDIDQDSKQETPQPFESKRVDLAETIGGSQTRKYLNKHVTPTLLEGMRLVAKNKPEDPLRYLGEYLIQASGKVSSEEAANNKPDPNAG